MKAFGTSDAACSGQNRGMVRGKVFAQSGWCFLLFFCLLANSQAASLAPEFRDLLNGTAYIHYIKVAVPGEMFSINGKDGVGWVYFEGSLQGATLWIRNCSNSIPGSGPMLPGYIVGVSSNDNWYARTDGYVAKSPKAGTSEEPTDKLVFNALLMMRSAFAPNGLKVGSLNVAEDNSFTALSNDGSKLTGQFDVMQNGRPTRCEYTASLYPKVSFEAVYGYTDGDSSSLIPKTVTTIIHLSAFHVIRRTYGILDCEFGKDAVPSGGFVASLWRPGVIMPLYTNAVIFSNNGVYQQEPGGTLYLASKRNAFEAHRSIIVWLVFIPANIALLSWLIVRARSKSTSGQRE